ncbi:hypothetical protein EJD97_000361 [Solanum chilense]|uniref:DUF4408 domain-containing protein n=1 Tax=Solanum chilense TaxID=4083 RepID=A0A6N2ANS3_SOLCI|nr:hypothetical protein EJD97_000361 [Solanum chilense]
MDSLQMKKIQAINKYRKQRLLNKIMLYSFTSMTCILILSSPLWYPLLRSFVKSILFDSVPKLGALFFSSKCIFLVGNIIVIVLVGESKIFKSSSNVLKQSYAAEQEDDDKNFIFVTGECTISTSKYSSSSSLPVSVNLKFGAEQEEEFCGYDSKQEEEEKGSVKGNYCTSNYIENEETEHNELSKRADDFIARVNNQIRLEAVSMF